jgi:hypothetical protein
MKDAWKGDLSKAALRLVTERPPYWEYLLFGQALADALGKHRGLRSDVEMGISFAAARRVDPMDIWGSIAADFAVLGRIVAGLEALVDTALPSALGPPGVAGDPEAICHVAGRIGDAFRATLEWSSRIGEIATDPLFEKLLTIMCGLGSTMVRDIEVFSEHCTRKIPEALSGPVTTGSPKVVEICLEFTTDFTEFKAETERVGAALGIEVSF